MSACSASSSLVKALDGFGRAEAVSSSYDNAQAAGLEPLKKLRDDGGQIGAARARNDADRLEDGSWLHECLRFYFRSALRAWRKYS